MAATFHEQIRVTRPRPQPIAGTPPPDPNEKCDANIIQQTCNLFGLDLVCSVTQYSVLLFNGYKI